MRSLFFAVRALTGTLRSSITHMSVLQRIIIAFFTVSFLMLFVGDGKQHVVDLLGSIFAISAYYYASVQAKPINTIPRYIHFLWIAYIGLSLTSTIFSISIGYSVSALVRIAIAFILYGVVIRHTRPGDIVTFLTSLSVFTVFATGISFLLFLQPSFLKLPSMNLLYPTYGHNHLADILLLALPISFHSLLNRRSYKSALFFCIVVLGFSITFSRGALFIAGLYIVFQTGLFWAKLNVRYRIAFAMIGFIFIQSLLIFSFTSVHSNIASSGITMSRLAVKPSFRLDARKGYWQQAISGFTRSPFLGNGPGTFYLLSKLHQNLPQKYSWFAHNFPLETLAELGIIGLIIIYILIAIPGIALGRNILFPHEKSPQEAARTILFHGIVLSSIYSLIEFNLNYLLIWMIFWFGCAFVFPPVRTPFSNRMGNTLLSKIVILFLLYYYGTSILILLIPGDTRYSTKLPLYITPYSMHLVTSLLDGLPKEQILTARELGLIKIFHKLDPEVNEHLARFYMARDHMSDADYFFQQSLTGDPQNTNTHNEYFKFLFASGESTEKIYNHIRRLDRIHLSDEDDNALSLAASGKLLEKAFTKENITESVPTPDYYVNLYHRIGLSLLPEEADTVKQLWLIMYHQNPGWSHFYIDFAGLMKYGYNDTVLAEEILQTCQKNTNAGRHCQEFTVETLPTHSVLREHTSFNTL